MLRLLSALLPSREHASYHLHYHFDDNGQRYVCDESICRPKPEPFFPYLR